MTEMNDQLKRDVDVTRRGDGGEDAVELLDRFADAWNRHDLEALMSMMTDDCVFEASAGSYVNGQRSEGKHGYARHMRRYSKLS